MAAVAVTVAIEGEAVWYGLFSILYYACLEGMEVEMEMETQRAWIKLGCVVLGWLPCVYMDCVLNIIGRALSEFGCVYWCCDVVVMLW